jgi:ABC-type Zn uptake system ZnuABC Zn-binding protein ZnuA
MAEVIQSNLAKVAPENAELYAKNTKAIAAELTQIDSWIKSQIATIPPASRTLITTHDALGYYSKAYGIPVAALEGISTEEKPTAARVKQTVKTIEKAKVPTIFAELTVNPKLLLMAWVRLVVKGKLIKRCWLRILEALLRGWGGNIRRFRLKLVISLYRSTI